MSLFQSTCLKSLLAGVLLLSTATPTALAKLSADEHDRFVWRALNSLSVLGFYETRCLLVTGVNQDSSINLFLKAAKQAGASDAQLAEIKAHYQQGLDFIADYQLKPHLEAPPCEAAKARTYQDGVPLKRIAENDIQTFCETDDAMAQPREGADYLKQQAMYRDCAKLQNKKAIMQCLKI